MRTIDQYFPAMNETRGRLLSVPRLSELGIAAAALAFALSGGFGVPLYQEHVQQARLDQANAPIVAALNHVRASIDQMKALVANQDRSRQDLVANYVNAIQRRTEGVHTVSVKQVRAELEKQVKAYAAAQALIANSPFKNKMFAFGPGAEKYLAATQVQKPEPGTDIMALALEKAQEQSVAAQSAEVYATGYEQSIVTLVGAGKPAASAPSVGPVPVAAVPAPAVAPAAATVPVDDSPAAKAAAAKATAQAAQKQLEHEAEQMQALSKTADRAAIQAAQKQLEQDAEQAQALTQAADRAAAQAKTSAINRESSNKEDSDSVGNFSILGSRSPATPRVVQKNTVHRPEPIVTKQASIVRPSPAATPPRPAQSDGFIEQ
jgi:hypothetical protein